jgi:hypothetical protein
MKKKALLIEWNPSSGKRAGNINPKDVNLRCNGWQNMNVTPALELRLVEDDRDLSKYKGIEGVTILHGTDQINASIDVNFPSKIVIEDELMYNEHVKEQIGDKKISIFELPNNRNKRLKELKDKYGIKGIREIKPQKV